MTRRGYSLIEMLVSIAVMAVLIGLFLAAVQKVRASAARLTCSQRLQQIALALHNRHDTLGSFPNSMDAGTSSTPYRSWRVPLLPYLEQTAIYDQSQRDYPVQRDFTKHEGFRRLLPMYVCPADDRAATTWIVERAGGEVALASYLGVSGTNSNARDGVLYSQSTVSLLHITDGASNTLMLGERPPSTDLRYSWWYAGIGLDGRGKMDHHLGVRELRGTRRYHDCGPGPYSFEPGRSADDCSSLKFWSLHADGANFAFADGRVQFLRYSADSVLPALATRAGGEVAPLD